MSPISDKQLDITCRPAKESDTSDVLNFTRLIWDGEDYIPEAWEEWLADPDGLLAVAEYKGHAVGIGKLSKISSTDWWLEGLRVNPKFEQHGIGTRIHHFLLDHFQKYCHGKLRLATSSERVQVHHLCHRTGFIKIGEFTLFTTAAFKAKSSGSINQIFSPVTSDEMDDALGQIQTSQTFELSYGLMEIDWQWAPPSIDLFRESLITKDLSWWRKPTGILILHEETDENSNLNIQLIACSLPRVGECLKDIRHLAKLKGIESVNWKAPLHPDLQLVLTEEGYISEWEKSLIIFCKTHDD